VTSIDRQELKRAHRAARERALANATLEASRTLGRKLYGCILADPPWSFAVYNDDTGQDRGSCNHYPTMTLADIKVLKIPDHKNAVLFLWATVPMLPQVLETMAAWGFTYESHFTWIKDKTGLGFWNRNRHELLLVGTRANIPCPAPGENFNSVIEAPRGRHSEKPAIVREMIAASRPSRSSKCLRAASVSRAGIFGATKSRNRQNPTTSSCALPNHNAEFSPTARTRRRRADSRPITRRHNRE
jgi:N6-adenosine-specific RNA methylase IME4